MKQLRIYKASGKDQVQMKVLKRLPKKATIHLYYINKASIERYFPAQWRVVTIIPIKSPGKNPAIPESYRYRYKSPPNDGKDSWKQLIKNIP